MKKGKSRFSIIELQNDYIKRFEEMGNWESKYDLLITLAHECDEISKELKTNENLIHGCQSKVWIASTCEEGVMFFTADAEGKIIKGIVTLLIDIFEGQEARDIVEADYQNFLTKIGFAEFLTPNRSNGVLLMIKRIKNDALMHTNTRTVITEKNL